MAKKALEKNPLEEKEEIMRGFYKPSDKEADDTAISKDVDKEKRKDVNTANQKITLMLPQELVKRIKIAAIERNLKMRELIEEALISYLEQ